MSSKPSDSARHVLTWRLGVWYAAIFIAGALVLSVFTYRLLARTLAAEDHDVLASMLTRYASEYQLAGLPGLERLIGTDADAGRHERLLVRVVGQEAEVVYFNAPQGWSLFDSTNLDRPAGDRTTWQTIDHPTDGSQLEIGSAHLRGGVTVQVGRSSRARDELLAYFREGTLEVVLLIVAIAVGGGVALTYAALYPLRALETTVRSILHTGRFDARVEIRGSRDPLDRLGALVNEMLGRIHTLVSGMRGALDNVAHDLRTPLTRLRNVAETALLSDDPAAARHALMRAVEEADRVNATLTTLIDISEAETGTMTLRVEPVVLALVVREAVDLYADEAEDRGIQISVGIDPALAVMADRTRLRQVLANLLENAIKYSGANGRIAIEAHRQSGAITISVQDTGLGISASDLPLIWDRLYRADRSRSTRGLGLGLSLVKAIVEAHGGQVSVSSTLGVGSTFSLVLAESTDPMRLV
jgi:signal transduction histidine kinase